MNKRDDDLIRFEAQGAAPLPDTNDQGYIENDGARIWYSSHGSGIPVILLHGGLGNSGNWGYQVPVLLSAGYRVVLMDSRGHGRSTRDERPFSYTLMASDVSAVMDANHLEKASLIGWSDGACTALVLASKEPARVKDVFFFGCNMDPSGTKEFVFTPTIGRCLNRHKQDYASLSATPDQFDNFSEAVGLMQRTQPNYSAQDLARISVPVTVAHSEHDEFIKREHAEYLARSIPNSEFVFLPGVSHFAPLQRPELFNGAILTFLNKSSSTYLTPEEKDRTVISSRIIDAQVDDVFDAYANPLKIVRWWGPDGFTLLNESIDLKEGGQWHFVFKGPDGAEFKNHLVFGKIERPHRFVVDHLSGPKYHGTVTFDAIDDKTLVTMYWTFENAEVFARFRDAVAAGNEGNFDRLSEVVIGRR